MLKNDYLREKLIGSHKNFVSLLTEDQLLKALESINVMTCPARDRDVISSTEEKYWKELVLLLEKYRKLRDQKEGERSPGFLEELQELSCKFLEFEFKVKFETDRDWEL